MNNCKRLVAAVLVLIMLFAALSGCSVKEAEFSYSDGLDENGFWKDVKALDCVEMFDYQAMSIPKEVHEISDEALQSEIDTMISKYSTGEHITNRAVADGDTVNIDYVGSVDGVEFDGGSTGGTGTDVTAGSTDYIDDFLTQIIGHMPGETINVEVTFPDNYGQEHLNGKDAVFVTTINYIVGEEVETKLTDAFVTANLYDEYGWKTVKEMNAGVWLNLQQKAIQEHIFKVFTTEVNIPSLPDKLVEYQENLMLISYQNYAAYNGMELEEILQYEGFADTTALLEASRETNEKNAAYALVMQAIAEDLGIAVTEDVLVDYFSQNGGTGDYSGLEDQYGLPYIKQVILCEKVLDYLTENAVLL